MTTFTADMTQVRLRSTPVSQARAPATRPIRTAQALGGLSIVVGAVVIVGWWLAIDAITSLVPGAPPMVANTALMGVLGGIALVLLAPVERAPARAITGRAFAVATCLVGAVTLLEYLVPIEASGFDLLIAPHQEHPSMVRYPGRPSPHTAVGFMAVGLALALIDARPRRMRMRPAELVLVAGMALPAAAMLGYIFDVEVLYGVPGLVPYTGMAINTALVLLMLGVGALLARPDEGMMAVITSVAPGGVAARRMLLGLGSLLVLGLLIMAGVVLGLYNASIAASLVVMSGFAATAAFILTTAVHLNRADAQAREGREGLARLAALVVSSDDCIHAMTLDGVVVHWNPACEAIYGFSAEEMVGRSIFEVIPPNLRERHHAQLAAIRRGERVEGYETLRQRKDGSLVPLSLTLSPISDEEGRPVGISTIARDITERRAAEEALAAAHAREQQLRGELERVLDVGAAVSAATAALSETSLQSVLTAIAAEAQMLTHAEYAAIGIGSSPDVPFEHWASVGVDDETARRIGSPPRPIGTLGIPARDGQVVRTPDVRTHPAFRGFPPGHPEMTSLLGAPICFSGKPVGNLYLANKQGAPGFTDADERILTMLGERLGAAVETARLYDSETLRRTWLQAIFDHMPEGVVILDEHGEVLLQNPAAHSLAAPPDRAEPAGRPPTLDFRAPDGQPLPDDELPGVCALRGRSIVGRELSVRRPDGGLVAALVSATPVHTTRGPAGAVIVLKDISLLKELERLREEWASVVAHDLRQPVAAIDLGAQALLHLPEGTLEAPVEHIVERIRASARRLTRMIDDLLDASRVEAERLSLERAPTDLSQLVHECIEETSEALDDHPVEQDIAAEVVAEVDGDRIRQVVCNLLTNAGKYGTAGTPVHVSLGVSEDTTEVDFAVTNHGPGIEADELPRLFGRFERTRGGKASGKSGLGLGLYITRGLVEAHGGRIWAESTPGETTTFYVKLPVGGQGSPDP